MEKIMKLKFISEGYRIGFKPGALELIKKNKSLYEEYLKYLKNEEGIEEINEDDMNCYVQDFIDICIKSKIDFKSFILEYNLIEITDYAKNKSYLTNLDIGKLCNYHNYAEHIICKGYENYLMITITDCGGQFGMVGIWDLTLKSWIFTMEGSHVYGILFAPEIRKFIALFSIGVWEMNSLGITIIDKDKNFKCEDIIFIRKGYIYDENDKSKEVNEVYHEIEYNGEIGKILSNCDSKVIPFKNQLEMYWDGKRKTCYVKEHNQVFEYNFTEE